MARFSIDYGLGNVSLNAVSATGAGDEFGIILKEHRVGQITWQKTVAGPVFTALQVDLEGSLDGVTWFQIDSDTTIGSSLRSLLRNILYIRARLVSFTGGGTVTVLISII